jgi:hypothetical protein
MIKKGLRLAPFLFLPIIFAACAGTRPLLDQSRAHAAQNYARANGGMQRSPKNYRMGLSLLKKADRFFEERRYAEAKKHYIYAMKYFEKSETRARLLNVKDGGVF